MKEETIEEAKQRSIEKGEQRSIEKGEHIETWRPPLSERRLLRLFEAGHTPKEIAEQMGYALQTVNKHMESLRDGGVILEVNDVETVDWGELEKRKAAERRYRKGMREFRAIQRQLKRR